MLSGGAHLAVTRWGDGDPRVLALHPGVGDSRIWQRCAPAWAAAGFGVVAYDRRGFGATSYEAENHDDLADLLAVTAATGARPATVVGNSMGGELALRLALTHADHVRALVLIAPALPGYPEEDWPLAPEEDEQDRLIAAAMESGDVDLVNRLEVRYWLDGVAQPEGRVGGPARQLMLDMNARALRADPVGSTIEHPPVWARVGEIGVPTLVVVGEYDLPGIVGQCRELAEAMPNGECVVMPGTAHCPSLDRPAELAGLVGDFLTREGG